MAFEIDLPPLTWHPNSAANAPALNMVSQTYAKRPYWAFDSALSENITSQQLIMPSNYDSSADLKIKILCGHKVQETGDARTIKWEVMCESLDTLPGTSGESVTTSNSLSTVANGGEVTFDTGSYYPMVEIDITLTNNDSVAAGKPFRTVLSRQLTVTGGSSYHYGDDALFYGAMLFQE
jgi:V8-like Glu-specific endopeptidase